MRWWTIVACLSVVTNPGSAILANAGPDAPEEIRQSTFDTGKAAAFGDPRPALREYVARHRPRWRGSQHFCVVGYRDDDPHGYPMVWIHWREGKQLLLWDGRDPDHPASLIGMGRKSLDLTRDVVADVGSSTYLVTKPWVDGVLADCARHGRHYTVTVRRRTRPAR